MYPAFQLALKYLKHLVVASNGRGHGVHSPFVFEFIKHVMNDRNMYPCYGPIEAQRQSLLRDENYLEVQDFGAGSAQLKTSKRKIKDIAASSLKSKKYAQLLFRIVQYYQPANILELGTSLGTSSSYLASGNKNANVYTLEGSEAIAAVAQTYFKQAGLDNIQILTGPFEDTLLPLLDQLEKIDLVFLDGNHRKGPTLQYFDQCLSRAHAKTIFIFDDIHWSREMEEAWELIRKNPAVTLTIDLFFIGIVMVDPSFKEKQHFKIRF